LIQPDYVFSYQKGMLYLEHFADKMNFSFPEIVLNTTGKKKKTKKQKTKKSH
jgi:hypothetical protein